MDWKNNPRSVLVAGFAQLPKGTTLYEVQKTVGCVLIIDRDTDLILDVSFTFIMDVTNEFICSLVRGRSVRNGVDEIVQEIEERFLAPAQRAIIQSLRVAHERYCEMVQY
ncbi:DUF3870 domain-containing protein [Brevibacillus sp. B_LB10_24]|uniref:DUF3870 domain-containing protein n=1 Tax=Brevibacillus sp. B_LB10_24 TaxID=3380645 RepID=UPI0038B98E36